MAAQFSEHIWKLEHQLETQSIFSQML